MTDGVAQVTFSSGDSPVSMSPLGGGLWSGTWMPHGTVTGACAVTLVAESSAGLEGTSAANGTIDANTTIPVASPGGIVSAANPVSGAPLAPGQFISIYGSNLASDSRGWGGSDFNGVNAPTALDGTSVTIGGEPAYIDYISPGQVNAQIPSSVATGAQQITLTTAGGTTSPFNITVNPVEPGLLAPASFNINGIQYAGALFADGTYVLPEGAINGLTSRAAKPGDTIVLFGVGFGPVTPNIPAGQIVQQANTLASKFEVSIGGVPATASYSGLTPDFVGLYQFNVVVPNVSASNAAPLTFTLGGAGGTQTLYVPIQN